MMGQAPLALALTAGMLAAVNPCGFALLPAYLSLLVIGDTTPPRRVALGRALAASTAMTGGFVAVFGLFGLVLAPIAGQLQQHLPWFTIGLGLLLAVLGVVLLTGRQLPALVPKLRRAPRLRRAWPSMVAFGAAYALASLSCTIAPFLAIVVANARASTAWEGMGLFVAYAAGMGLIVGAAAVAVAVARVSPLTRLRRLGPAVSRAGGVLLLVVGGYVAYYGWYEIRLLHDGTPNDPVIAAATTVQQWLASGLNHVGIPAIATSFAVLLAAALLLAHARRGPAHRGQHVMRPADADPTPPASAEPR
jgi:cytochrome c-type biogenesis protein